MFLEFRKYRVNVKEDSSHMLTKALTVLPFIVACSLLPVTPSLSRRSVLSGALVSTVALLDVPASAVDTPAPSMDMTKARFLEEAQRPSSSGSTNGKINGIDATMVSSEDAEKLKKAAAAIPDPDIPVGSDLERMLNGDGVPVGRSVANPLAHGN